VKTFFVTVTVFVSSRHLMVAMSQLWITLNQPPRKTDVENYINSDQNIVWQELQRRNQLKAEKYCERFTLPNCNLDNTGEW